MQIIEPKYFMLNCKYIGVGLSYEDYLLEILNWSGYFRSKSEDKSEYVAPKTEDHGEADAYSTDYQIDFKLLIDEEMMRGLNKNKPTVNKEFIDKGIIMVQDNPTPTPIPKKNILVDIMRISPEEIASDAYTSETAKHFIKNMEKNKNLFLYYPYEHTCQTPYSVKAFAYLFTQIFKVPLCYRAQKCPDKDTFICVKVNENFLIFEWTDQEFVFVDKVNELLCSAYRDYKLFSFF